MPRATLDVTAPPAAVRPPQAFKPIKTKRAFEEVCDQIRQGLTQGTLRPGDRLPPERELAEQLGVSRTAIREAMRSLENAGLVQCQQGMGGGAFIRKGSASTVTQAVSDMVMLDRIPARSVTEARVLLIDQAIRLACERATEADFRELEQDIDRAAELTARGDFTRRNDYITEFYRILARATHNEVIVMLVESLSELTRDLLARTSPVPRSDVIGVRRSVVKHMRNRDADKAAREMRAHLERLGRLLEGGNARAAAPRLRKAT